MKLRLAGAGVLAALALSALGCSASDEGEDTLLPSGRAIGTGRSITPTTHLFADRVTARLDVILDRRLLDPERVDLKTAFAPYEQVGEAVLDRDDSGPYSRLRYELTLHCQTAACLPETIDTQLKEGVRGERRTFRLAPAEIRYDDPTGDLPPVLRTVSWPALTSISRISVADVGSDFPFRSSPASLPSPTHRVAPWLLVGAFSVAALASLVWPLTFGVRVWRARQPSPVAETEPELSALEQALLLVERAADDPDDEARRSALEHLAVELEHEDAAALAGHASVLAWSRATPSAEAALMLTERVRESNGFPASA